MAAAYGSLSLTPPTPSMVILCHGFGCRLRTEIGLGRGDHAALTRIMASGKGSAAAERRAVATVVQWFDRRVGPEAGTAHHVANAGPEHMGDAAGQFDCIDASRNTTSILLVLDQMDLLKYHRVEETVARGAFIDGRYPHATAVLSEISTGKKWAVDSWTHAAGEKPDVMPLQVWLQAGGGL